MDLLEYDIKYMLASSPGMILQWKNISKTLWFKYEKELRRKYRTENSFSVTLQRKLDKLIRVGDLRKDVKGHQQVFYFIPVEIREKVIDELNKESVLKKFDEFWEKFSMEQKKKLAQETSVQQQFFVCIMQEFISNLLTVAKEMVAPWIDKFENTTEEITAKYSPEERKAFTDQFLKMEGDLKRIEYEIARDNQPMKKEEFNELLNLIQEFMEKVVPNYHGGWREANIDLMRKAIAEENKKRLAKS